jgi:DNA-binding CsgD family transcriptional regulator
MTVSLKSLFEEIYHTKDKDALRLQVIPKVGEYFITKRSGIFFLDRIPFMNRNLQEAFKLALSVEYNPVARYLTERHTPVHEGLVTTPKAWSIICPRPDHWHVMAGPIVNSGQIVGVVGCTREKSMSAFDSQNLADLSAICLHLSAWVAQEESHFKSNLLTKRELEIVELVALGKTNAEIGDRLWITENSVKQALKRMFRKLEVSSRTEMVIKLNINYSTHAR